MDSEPSPTRSPDAQRPFEPSAATSVSNARWDSRSVGKRWQFAFFALLLRAGGRRLAYLFMYVVATWYVLLRPFVRRRCRYYLNRRFPEVRNPLVRLWHDYRRVEALGESLIDRGAFGLLGPGALQLDFPEGPRLRELMDEGRGLIFLNSHCGCWQVAMSALRHLRAPVSIVMHQGAADIDPHWFGLPNAPRRAGDPFPSADGEAGSPNGWDPRPRGSSASAGQPGAAVPQGGPLPFSIIDPAQPMGGVLEMIAALKANHILGLMADRVFGDDPNTLLVPFLGAPVHFPVSPYRLASMQGTPIAVVSSYKTGFSRYRIELARIIRVPPGLGRSNAVYAPYLRQFVEALESFVSAHPWQFFNFHDMWQS
jgi:predicted LPLAT superfamily acyltransferase